MRPQIAAIAVLLTAAAHAGPVEEGSLRDWDGAWLGSFEVRTSDGQVHALLEVAQIYESEGDDLQRARFVEVDKSGSVVTVRAENRRVEGRLLCEVWKSTGDHALHEGAWIDGTLVWHRRTADGSTEECFVERIVGDEYQIDGAGVYGAARTLFLFRGRLRRVAREVAEAWMADQGVPPEERAP